MRKAKKRGCTYIVPLLVSVICVVGMAIIGVRKYESAAFSNVSAFCQRILTEKPELETELLFILKEYQAKECSDAGQNNFIEQYGYTQEDFGKETGERFWMLTGAAIFLISLSFAMSTGYERRSLQKRLDGLTDELERVNTGESEILTETAEDEFSQLQDEIYKTVTALYQTKEAAVRAKMNFAGNLANIAHQLKTPITSAFLSLQLMEQSGQVQYGKQIKQQLERLNQLEEALLTLSKIDAGSLYLEREKVDIYTALNLAAENMEELLRKENVTVAIAEKGCVEIEGDMEWTMQAFMNLIKNCMEHSASGGTIYCDYSENLLYKEIKIWDEGTGFAPQDIPHLFERFYRGEKAAGNGMGIGLSLAKSIVELQNGTITAYNLPIRGACFEIRVYSH